MIVERISEALSQALGALGVEGVVPVLEHPQELSYGDYSTNIALATSKKLGKNPRAFAEEIFAKLGSIEGVEKVEIAGAGFINFYLTRAFFAESVGVILTADSAWGKNSTLSGKRVIVEYSQPNPFKPFHIGHLMSTAVGETISRFVEWAGADIYRANYGGDIGPHVAKCMWGLQKENLNPDSIADLGKAYVIGNSAYEESPEAKAEINALNKRLYANDPDLKTLYDKGRASSLKHFEDLYAVLDTKFDRSFYESETAPLGKILVEAGLQSGIFENSDGAVVYKGEKKGLHTRVFLTSQGTPTYETKELGFAELKQSIFPFDLNITTVAVEQDGFFKVVEAALGEVIPEMVGKYKHVTFGMMQLAGGKMSSRKGNIITGESLIEDMRQQALLKMEGRDLGDARQGVADAVAVAAIKYSILKQARGKNIIFDPGQSLSFEGDSGPYLQYSLVRARAILRKAQTEGIKPETGNLKPGTLPSDVSVLERLLYRFPEVIERSTEEYEPHHTVTFLTELASAFNSWYAQGKIVDSADPTSAYKVTLVRAFATTMKNGLWVLGMRAPEAM